MMFSESLLHPFEEASHFIAHCSVQNLSALLSESGAQSSAYRALLICPGLSLLPQPDHTPTSLAPVLFLVSSLVPTPAYLSLCRKPFVILC